MLRKYLLLIICAIFLPAIANAAATETVHLTVPFIIEIPDGTWTGPWKNACEEAAMSMVDQYYQGVTKVGRQDSKKLMQPLFDYQDSVWGSNADSDASRTVKIIEANLDFTAVIKRNPTPEQIKNELRNGRPVISFHYAKYLTNPDHRFRVNGSYYHVMVISGFDEAKQQFIVEDSGGENGLDYRYSYDMLMNTLADFDYKTKKTDGPPTVIFTAQNLLAKAKGSNRVYLVQNNVKQYISHPDIFKTRGWKWSKVHIVSKEWLDSLPRGEMITK